MSFELFGHVKANHRLYIARTVPGFGTVPGSLLARPAYRVLRPGGDGVRFAATPVWPASRAKRLVLR